MLSSASDVDNTDKRAGGAGCATSAMQTGATVVQDDNRAAWRAYAKAQMASNQAAAHRPMVAVDKVDSAGGRAQATLDRVKAIALAGRSGLPSLTRRTAGVAAVPACPAITSAAAAERPPPLCDDSGEAGLPRRAGERGNGGLTRVKVHRDSSESTTPQPRRKRTGIVSLLPRGIGEARPGSSALNFERGVKKMHERLLALKRGGSTDPRLECGSCPFLQADVAPAEIGQRAAPQCLEKERMPRAAPGAGSSEATSKGAEQTTREDGQHASVAYERTAPAGQHLHDETNFFARARAARRAALEAEKAELQAKIAEIESRLHGSDVSSADEDEDHSLPAHRSRGTLAEWPNGAVRLPRTGSYHRLDVQQRQIDAKSKYVVGMKSDSAPGADSNNAGSQSPVLVVPVRQSGAAADARLGEAARDADDDCAGGRRASRAPLTLPSWGNSRHNSVVPEADSGERLLGAVLQRSGSQGGRTLVRSGSCCDQTVRGG